MKDFFKKACTELNLTITDNQIEDFFTYKDLLLSWNEKINLTAITNEKEIILKHFIDSISVCRYIDFSGKNVIDIGTGAGFPAIPIKIFCPDFSITLLDALNKRINFLKEVASKINIQNVTFLHKRAEDIDSPLRESFDICTARAVASLNILLEYAMPFVKLDGMFIAFKGSNVYEEIDDAKNAIKLFGGEICDIKTIKLPFLDINHTLVFIKKLRQTPNKYPRKAGKAIRNPIK